MNTEGREGELVNVGLLRKWLVIVNVNVNVNQLFLMWLK